MTSLSISHLSVKLGEREIISDLSFDLRQGEIASLLGPSGCGKTTLLRIAAGLDRATTGSVKLIDADGGAYTRASENLSVCFQDARLLPWRNVTDNVALPLELAGVSRNERIARANQVIAAAGLSSAQARLPAQLSGGMRMRVALARTLVTSPDVLLLDEPTNHLDLDSIAWLEQLLIDFKGSVVAITHDRAFLDRIATCIVELDRGRLRSYPGNFAQYQINKEEQMAQEAVISAKTDKLLAQEEVWIRKGVEARRTRSQSRIVRLENLRATRSARREQVGRVRMEVASGAPTGKLVAELTDVCKSFTSPEGDVKVILKDFTATLLRGDKIGLLGPNGAGKTTLLKMILGELEADSGKIRQGANLQVAYFDQMRNALDLEASLEDFISPGSEWIEIGNKRQHVKSYLGDFLFSPARATSPVKSLSGGERNRLLLARLFARPANVLVLDEPTNDLDIETLELLEELLQDYQGTVFLVSHDRAFMDNVVTSIIACEATPESPGFWREYEGSVQDWLTQSLRSQNIQAQNKAAAAKAATQSNTANKAATPSQAKPIQAPTAQPNPAVKSAQKLSYKEQRELDGLPALIEGLEKEQSEVQAALADSTLFAQDPAKAAALFARDAQIDTELVKALERWEALSTP